MKIQKPSLLVYQLSVLSRVIAGVVGGYIVVTLFSLLLAYTSPSGAGKGLAAGLLVSFMLYAFAIIWAFSARTAIKVWLGLFYITIPLALFDIYFFLQGTVL